MSIELASLRSGQRFQIETTLGGIIILRFRGLVESTWPLGGEKIEVTLEAISVPGFQLGEEASLAIGALSPHVDPRNVEGLIVMGICITKVTPGTYGLLTQSSGAGRTFKIACISLI